MIKIGTLIELRDGTKAIATTNTYTHRFLDAEDHEMIAHGMGHLAGSYGSAFDVVIPSTGNHCRVRVGKQEFKMIAKSEPTA